MKYKVVGVRMENEECELKGFVLLVKKGGETIYRSRVFKVPSGVVMDRWASETLWNCFGYIADAVLNKEEEATREAERGSMLKLIRTAYWDMVSQAGPNGLPKGWGCVLYMPGFLGGMTCDNENGVTIHPWKKRTCGLHRLDYHPDNKKREHKCPGRRPDKWCPYDL